MTYTPFWTEGTENDSHWLITCDHATNTIPPFVGGGSLGVAEADMNRHIAYDIGAAGVASELARALKAPAIFSNFSRLVIDPNRGLDDPTLVMKLYDGTIIPGNRAVDEAEVRRRVEALYAPYHDALAALAARRDDTVIVSVHSFTPRFQNRALRPWQIGLLFADDDRLARPMLKLLRAEADLCVGENEPYSGHLPGDAIDQHATVPGRLNILIEIRNDLISTAQEQAAWAARLAPILTASLAKTLETAA